MIRRVRKQSKMVKTRSADPRKPVAGKHAWNKQQEEYLVDLYEAEAFLWDFTLDDYQNTEKKNRTHNSIATLLKVPRKCKIHLLSPTFKIC